MEGDEHTLEPGGVRSARQIIENLPVPPVDAVEGADGDDRARAGVGRAGGTGYRHASTFRG